MPSPQQPNILWRLIRLPFNLAIGLLRWIGLFFGLTLLVAGATIYLAAGNEDQNAMLLKQLSRFDSQGSSSKPREIPSQTLLYVPITGYLVERITDQAQLESELRRAIGDQSLLPNTSVHKLTWTLKHARDDERVQSIILDVSAFINGSPALLNEVADAIDAFRASGKKVLAFGAFMTQGGYFLSTHSDFTVLDSEGGIYLPGYGVHSLFYADMLEKLKVNVHAFIAGNYKSAPEVFTSNRMSPYAKKAANRWTSQLWNRWKQRLEKQRAPSAEVLQSYADSLDRYIGAADGDWARAATEARMLDATFPVANLDFEDLAPFYNSVQQQFWDAKDSQNTANADESEAKGKPQNLELPIRPGGELQHHLTTVHWLDYRELVEPDEPPEDSPHILILFAEGTVGFTDAEDSFDVFRLGREIRDAVNADTPPSAIVLRVNSPGGSVAASEMLRRAIKRVRDVPIVVSFGGVGASGAYYLATAADQIWADADTITGSIGVFSVLFTLEDGAKWAGLGYDGTGTTELSGSNSLLRPLHPALSSLLNARTEYTYRNFKQLVADSRNYTPEQAEAVAQGQVWTGSEAMENGLLDGLGGLESAIEAAAKAAGLEEGQYRKAQLSERVNLWKAFWPILPLLQQKAAWLDRLLSSLTPADQLLAAARPDQLLSRYLQSPAPQNMYAECLECSALFAYPEQLAPIPSSSAKRRILK